MRKLVIFFLSFIVCISIFNCEKKQPKSDKNLIQNKIIEEIIPNKIVIQLNHEKAPKTVDNFLAYCKQNFYTNTIFHRVISNFMIQGGGLTADMVKRETMEAIVNEANNGLSNVRGSIAMARIPEPHSATAQFFINVTNNSRLDFRNETPAGWGYCVFGKVIEGMDIVDKISKVKTTVRDNRGDVPIKPITIKIVRVDGYTVTFGIEFQE